MGASISSPGGILSDVAQPVDGLVVDVQQADSKIDPHGARSSVRRNVDRMISAVESSTADLVVFGECFVNGYLSGGLLPALALDRRPGAGPIEELAAAVHGKGTSLLFGATTSKGSFPGSLYNSAILISPDQEVCVIDKTHLSEFRYHGEPVIAERMDWTPGSALSPIVEIAGTKIGIQICHDIVFPEVSRSLALCGAEVIVNLSAAVSGFGWFWDSLTTTRAFENSLWFVHATVVNERGTRPELICHSRVVDPVGQTVAELPDGEESSMTCILSSQAVRDARAALKPFTERRPGLYFQDPISDGISPT